MVEFTIDDVVKTIENNASSLQLKLQWRKKTESRYFVFISNPFAMQTPKIQQKQWIKDWVRGVVVVENLNLIEGFTIVGDRIFPPYYYIVDVDKLCLTHQQLQLQTQDYIIVPLLIVAIIACLSVARLYYNMVI
jgi:hypothetical protein